ncbi:cupin domain-containing protein [Kiloniella laminariae]|uniref:Cupin domain-containing protein n=1 Tax=Kiloniella laminariae TaxID=454162 RepID=A0ABT4LPC4_9PROT|nr:cupin domain-containing protein [Kiloniella laminariae]MCZ4282932.1 cupin domain-containing protein [Kiloniella laminariae]
MSSSRNDEFLAAATNDRIGTELVLETAEMKVWHLRLEPGERLPAHRHDRPYFWSVLTDGMGRSCFGDGREVDIIYQAGETRHFADLTSENGFVHDLTNTGKSTLVFVTVEFSR